VFIRVYLWLIWKKKPKYWKKQVKKSRKRRKIELNLKKQTQFWNGQNEHKYLYERILWRFLQFQAAKKQSQFKAKQSQSYLAPRPALGVEKTKPKPGFARKSEARNTKFDNSGGVAGCLLPRVGRETSWKGLFEKTNPISKQVNWRKVLYERWLWRISCFEDGEKQSQFKAKSRPSAGNTKH